MESVKFLFGINLKVQDVRVWTGFNWLKIGSNSGISWTL